MSVQGQWLGDWPGSWFGASGTAPTTQGGYRSLLAFWSGGATNSGTAPTTQGGYRSLLAFWTGGATSGLSAPPAAIDFYSGGWEHHPWLRRRKQYVEEQEIPHDVEEAIVASVTRVSEERSTVRDTQTAHAAAERALREFLNEQKQAWKELYAQLIRLEYERREQEYEDAQIALMLFDM